MVWHFRAYPNNIKCFPRQVSQILPVYMSLWEDTLLTADIELSDRAKTRLMFYITEMWDSDCQTVTWNGKFPNCVSMVHHKTLIKAIKVFGTLTRHRHTFQQTNWYMVWWFLLCLNCVHWNRQVYNVLHMNCITQMSI